MEQKQSIQCRTKFFRLRFILLCLMSHGFCASPAMAQQPLVPDAMFIQQGWGKQAHEASAGLVWDWDFERNFGTGKLSGYWEVSLSRWSYTRDDRSTPTWLGQIGLIPVFRYRPDAGNSPWFAEAGIGLTIMSKLYKTEDKRFSTSFNFGDHLALGRKFGARRGHELALRFEHFSNGGIRHPNPGENFIQLRYTLRFS